MRGERKKVQSVQKRQEDKNRRAPNIHEAMLPPGGDTQKLQAALYYPLKEEKLILERFL